MLPLFFQKKHRDLSFAISRINSKEISAFTDVAWVPTLLPSSLLGSVSNSPSACFVASDGNSLRVYQAVIDARSLLAEVNTMVGAKATVAAMSASMLSVSSNDSSTNNALAAAAANATKVGQKLSIVSSQSTARPGAIIELEPISDATQVRSTYNTKYVYAYSILLI